MPEAPAPARTRSLESTVARPLCSRADLRFLTPSQLILTTALASMDQTIVSTALVSFAACKPARAQARGGRGGAAHPQRNPAADFATVCAAAAHNHTRPQRQPGRVPVGRNRLPAGSHCSLADVRQAQRRVRAQVDSVPLRPRLPPGVGVVRRGQEHDLAVHRPWGAGRRRRRDLATYADRHQRHHPAAGSWSVFRLDWGDLGHERGDCALDRWRAHGNNRLELVL